MKETRYSEQQILDILEQVEAAQDVADFSQVYGISKSIIHR